MVTVGLELKKVLFCYSYDVNMRILADMSAENEWLKFTVVTPNKAPKNLLWYLKIIDIFILSIFTRALENYSLFKVFNKNYSNFQ